MTQSQVVFAAILVAHLGRLKISLETTRTISVVPIWGRGRGGGGTDVTMLVLFFLRKIEGAPPLQYAHDASEIDSSACYTIKTWLPKEPHEV